MWSDIDVARVRADASEQSTWLACIFSWLTPYQWQTDVIIVVAVGLLNWAAVTANRAIEAKKNGQ